MRHPRIPPPTFDLEQAVQKIDQYVELTELSTELALAGIRHQNPGISDTDAFRLLRERLKMFRAEKWSGCG